MWGFNIDAYSNTGFVRNRGGSSEGDLWMKYAFKKTVPKPIGRIAAGMIEGLEAQFADLKKVLIQAVSGVSTDFQLYVDDGDSGHAIFCYNFWKNTPAAMIEYEFLYAIKRSGYDLGDQVMIQLCIDIVQFEDHLTVSPGAVEKVGLPALFVTIYF